MGNIIGGNKMAKKNTAAIAVFFGKIKGIVKFIQIKNYVEINIKLSGFDANSKHGFHVHRCGDMSKMCDSMCDHFNPYNKTHGGGHNPSAERHVGDLGNIIADINGDVNITIYDNYISLKKNSRSNIIGRGLVIHEDSDDCGLGVGNKKKESLITGNSGKRIACAVIGIAM